MSDAVATVAVLVGGFRCWRRDWRSGLAPHKTQRATIELGQDLSWANWSGLATLRPPPSIDTESPLEEPAVAKSPTLQGP